MLYIVLHSVSDSENTDEELAHDVETLKEKVERLEENQKGKNRMTLTSHDISVRAVSEDTNLETMSEILSDEMEEMSKRALMGEYQTLEEENLFAQLFQD